MSLVKQQCQDEGVLASNSASSSNDRFLAHDFVDFHQNPRSSASGIEPEKPIEFPRFATLYRGFYALATGFECTMFSKTTMFWLGLRAFYGFLWVSRQDPTPQFPEKMNKLENHINKSHLVNGLRDSSTPFKLASA